MYKKVAMQVCAEGFEQSGLITIVNTICIASQFHGLNGMPVYLQLFKLWRRSLAGFKPVAMKASG